MHAQGESAIEGIHHIEAYVSNSYQASHFYRSALGFQVIGTAAISGGLTDRSTLAMQRGGFRLLLTAPHTSSSPVSEHIHVHGEGIKDIAFSVSNVDATFHVAVSRGARPLMDPLTHEDRNGIIRKACIGACGDLVHTIIDHSNYTGPMLPGYVRPEASAIAPDTALDGIDHIALALDIDQLDRWVEFYVSALGYHETFQADISTEYSAMRSKVVETSNGVVRFPMMEPARAKRQSQIQTYLDSHIGPGVQHLALSSRDIVKSVSVMSEAGVAFLSTPRAYYDTLQERVGSAASELETLRRLGILVDRDPAGHLFQIFTNPIGARPTLFLEVIERRGAAGFGRGNVKALFEAVERSQAAGRAT